MREALAVLALLAGLGDRTPEPAARALAELFVRPQARAARPHPHPVGGYGRDALTIRSPGPAFFEQPAPDLVRVRKSLPA